MIRSFHSLRLIDKKLAETVFWLAKARCVKEDLLFKNFEEFKEVVNRKKRSFACSKFSIVVPTLFLSVSPTVGETIFTDTIPGPVPSLILGAGTYQIVATGGAGGNSDRASGGRGAVIEGTFTLTDTETLSMLVGGKGGDADGGGGGGGGGTFVFGPGGVTWIIAGAGGGAGSDNGLNGGNGTGGVNSGGAGGSGGGNAYGGAGGGAGGGGLTGNGANGLTGGGPFGAGGGFPGGNGGFSFSNGAAGGGGANVGEDGFGNGGNGGLGGGGGGGAVAGGGGGGGGYSGGNGGADTNGDDFGLGGGGGGSSFNALANPSYTIATSAVDGSVFINLLAVQEPPASVPEPAGLTALGAGLGGLAWLLRRMRKRQITQYGISAEDCSHGIAKTTSIGTCG